MAKLKEIFNFTVQQKIHLWEETRYEVEAETLEEAVEKFKEYCKLIAYERELPETGDIELVL